MRKAIQLSMSELRNTTIEENFPAIRRRATNSDSLMKHSVGEGLLTLGEERGSVREEESIGTQFRKIHCIIDSVDDHITRRLENHQNEVFSLVKGEVEEMRQETRAIVERLNAAIAEKNTEDEIWKLNNELDYFKSQTYQLFRENKQLKEESAAARRSLKEMQVELTTSDLLMQKLRKKYMRENFLKNKVVAAVKEKIATHQLPHLTPAFIDQLLNLNGLSSRGRNKTEPIFSETPDPNGKFFESRVAIDLGGNSRRPPPMAEEREAIMENSDSILGSLKDGEVLQSSQFPPVQFKRVESVMRESVPSLIYFKRVDKCIQTEGVAVEGEPRGEVRQFSNTSYIDLPKPPARKLDLTRNGFFVRSYNQKIDKLGKRAGEVQGSVRRESRHTRYMSKALSKGKLGAKTEVRESSNKSSLK